MSEEDDTLAALASLPELYHPRVSPDGSLVAYYYDVSGRNELYVLDRETGEHHQVTDGEVPRDATWWVQWDDAGDRILFHRDDDGDEMYDVLALSVEGSWTDPGAVRVEPLLEPDSQAWVLDTSDDWLLYATDEDGQMNLGRYEFATGDRRALTVHEQPVLFGAVSPDGSRVAYVGNESDRLTNRDVFVMGADGSETRRLDVGEDGSEAALGGWFPDGERLLVSDDSVDLERVGIYDLTTDEIEWLGPHEHEETPVAVSPDGRRVLVARKRHAATVPVVYDRGSNAGGDAIAGRELDLPEGVVGVPPKQGQVFADETTVVFTHSTASDRERLLEYDLATDESRVLVNAEYGEFAPDDFPDAEYVTYESEDGLEIGGLLYDPREGPARERDETDLPGVVYVHGGPHFQSQREFNVYVQFLLFEGYAVFQPNYRGSTGRGREFERAIHGDWGGMEQADVAAGGRWLLDRQWVDDDRVAVFGGSFGGYSVYCQLTQYPTLWTTGLAWVGITDLHRLYEEDMSYMKHHFRMQMGDPEENYDLWRERSPIEHADRMERSICIVHAVNDPRCPIEQARIFRDALEERGWEDGEDFVYEELGELGHGSTDIDQKIRTFTILADYLDDRL